MASSALLSDGVIPLLYGPVYLKIGTASRSAGIC